MMEQKMKEEEERKRTKEIEERMSLEETKEQVWNVTFQLVCAPSFIQNKVCVLTPWFPQINIRWWRWGKNFRDYKKRNISSFYSSRKFSTKRRKDEEKSRGIYIYIYTSLSLLFCQRIVNCRLSFLVSLFSDITTLTSASYQQSLPMHPGQHLLGIQGEKSSRFCALPESSLFFI